MRKCLFILSMALLSSSSSWAFRSGASYIGVGFYSQNILNRIASKDDGSAGFLGSSSYPLLLKQDWSVFGDWFFSPQLTYTLIARSSAADSAKTTIMHIMFPFGKNLGGSGQRWDWFVGPGFIHHSIKGAGGTTQLSNGTGTATFALPGKASVIQNITFNTGVGFGFDKSRVALDIIVENLGSSTKRSQSLMLGYAYNFGGH